MIQNARLVNNELYIPDYMIYTMAVIAMVFVIIKLNKLEKERLSVTKNSDTKLEGDKNV